MIDNGSSCFSCTCNDVHHTGRKICIANDLCELHCCERCCFSRLQYKCISCSKSRSQLPGYHQQREVPGDHLSCHAQRLWVTVRKRILKLISPAGIIEEMIGCKRHIDVS